DFGSPTYRVCSVLGSFGHHSHHWNWY
ncbi:hypothetical protein Golob_024558, partial [Gossypium lobatum]|nr:hypothetical protein [Gossypium lobatum]